MTDSTDKHLRYRFADELIQLLKDTYSLRSKKIAGSSIVQVRQPFGEDTLSYEITLTNGLIMEITLEESWLSLPTSSER